MVGHSYEGWNKDKLDGGGVGFSGKSCLTCEFLHTLTWNLKSLHYSSSTSSFPERSRTSLVPWISLAPCIDVLPTPHQDKLMPPVKTANYVTHRLIQSLYDGLQNLKSSWMPSATLLPLTDHLPTLLHINNSPSVTKRMVHYNSPCLPNPPPPMTVNLLPHLNRLEIMSQHPLPLCMLIQSHHPASLCGPPLIIWVPAVLSLIASQTQTISP